jgi:hypothetical protein
MNQVYFGIIKVYPNGEPSMNLVTVPNDTRQSWLFTTEDGAQRAAKKLQWGETENVTYFVIRLKL